MDPEFRKRLLATYRAEAVEHLDTAVRCLISLDRGLPEKNRTGLIQEVYREFHSLKGAARAVNELAVESICHRCEDILSEVLSGRIRIEDTIREKLLATVSELKRWHQAQPAGEVAPAGEEVEQLLRTLSDFAGNGELAGGEPKTDREGERVAAGEVASSPSSAATAPAGTVRTPVARLDSILHQAEEMVGLREDAAARLGDLITLNNRLNEWRIEWGKAQSATGLLRFLVSEAVRFGHGPDVRRSLARIHRFLDWNREFFEDVDKKILDLVKDGTRFQGTFEMGVDKLLDDTKEVLMVPFSYVFEGMAMYVTDLSRRDRVRKRARMYVVGGAVEIDRRILEAMKDPFMHIVRNAIDHGIESVAEREERGKPAEGAIHVTISPLGDGTVEVRITDDGRGISIEGVRRKAVEAGIIQENDADRASPESLLELLFLSRFSTRESVSETSGRGIGLSIVKEVAERIGGNVKIESAVGAGTTFRIVLPLSLARFRAIEAWCGGSVFLLPIVEVRRVGRVRREEIRPVNGRGTVAFRSRTLPLYHPRAFSEYGRFTSTSRHSFSRPR